MNIAVLEPYSDRDEFEEFIDFDNNGDWTIGNSMYNGLLCRPEDVAINFGARLDNQKFLGTIFDYVF